MLAEELIRRRRVTQPQPMDERLPDGRTVAELMMGVPALAGMVQQPATPATPPFNPAAIGPPTPSQPITGPPPGVRLGNAVPAGSSRLGQLMAERDTLSQAPPSSAVKRTPWGYEEQPPERSPSRLKHAGLGAVHGASIASQASKGDPWATIAGAVTGAVGGGVSPALMQAFQRRQELDRSTGDVATEQALQLRNAQIGETEAQTEQRRIQPILEMEKLRREEERTGMLEEGRNQRAELGARTRMETAAESNRLRQADLEETRRHNRETERKPGSKYRTVANTIFEVDDDGIWRVAPGAPPPFSPADAARAEREGVRSTERDEKSRQAEALFRKGSEYWDQAKAKRDEARKLSLGPDGNPSRVAAVRNEDAITRLNREAEGLEKRTHDVQTQGDILAAQSEAAPTSTTSTGGGKAFDLRRWKRDHPGADPSGVIKRAKDAGMRIIE